MNTTVKKPQIEPKPCECGCGELAKNRFRQGHDARLKSTLIKAALAGGKRAAQKLESLGWTKFLEAKRQAAQETEGEEKRVQTRKPRKAVDSLPEMHGPSVEPFRVLALDAEGMLPEDGFGDHHV